MGGDLEPRPWETEQGPRPFCFEESDGLHPGGDCIADRGPAERRITVCDAASSGQLTHLVISGRQP
jgi:hypothetical protein